MAFIVKDKTPINCQACFISRIGNICFCRRKITKEEWNTTNKRPDWCPLVEIPSGSKLVDANELIDKSEWYGERATYNNPMPEGVEAVNIRDIENATIFFKEDE